MYQRKDVGEGPIKGTKLIVQIVRNLRYIPKFVIAPLNIYLLVPLLLKIVSKF